MARSVESSRPMLAPSASKRASNRYSTYSTSPSLAVSEAATVASTASSNDPRVAEIKSFTEGLTRLESQPLQQQRYAQTSQQSDDMSKLALQAKLERALDRRMTSQDAVLRSKSYNEKQRAMA